MQFLPRTKDSWVSLHNGFMKGHGLSRDGLYMFDKLRQLDWLNKHHFDYRGLIDKRLALEAKEGMYND